MLATPQTPSKVNLCLLFRDLGTRVTIRRPSLPNRTTPSILSSKIQRSRSAPSSTRDNKGNLAVTKTCRTICEEPIR